MQITFKLELGPNNRLNRFTLSDATKGARVRTLLEARLDALPPHSVGKSVVGGVDRDAPMLTR